MYRANSSATAVSVFCPPESREMPFRRVPGGCAMISMPLSRMSSAWISSRRACPPPKSAWKVYSKFFRTCSKVSSNCCCDVRLISSMAWSSWAFAPVRSSLCWRRKSYRCRSSEYSSMATRLTAPMLLSRWRRASTDARTASQSVASKAARSASAGSPRWRIFVRRVRAFAFGAPASASAAASASGAPGAPPSGFCPRSSDSSSSSRSSGFRSGGSSSACQSNRFQSTAAMSA